MAIGYAHGQNFVGKQLAVCANEKRIIKRPLASFLVTKHHQSFVSSVVDQLIKVKAPSCKHT